MNHKLKRKWCAALRGNGFHQGRLCLLFKERNGIPKHCVLGVLASVADIPLRNYGSNEPEDPHKNAYMAIYELITEVVANQMVVLNDCDGKTFPELADWIEENL
jgi:hypothetical protein